MADLHTPAAETNTGVHPAKFTLWLYLITVVMLFAGFTSALIVSRTDNMANGQWLQFQLPSIFLYSTLVLAASSISLHLAWQRIQQDQRKPAVLWMSATLALGTVFLVLQFLGYAQLVQMGVFLVGNVAGSFLYVISGVHGLHLVGGLIALLVVLVNIFRFRVHSKRTVGFYLAMVFWHALDFLWLYLFVFLSFLYG